MQKKNILLLCGGGGSEHEISLISAQYMYSQLSATAKYNIIQAVILEKQWQTLDGKLCYFGDHNNFHVGTDVFPIDFVVPCIHGKPGETGDIQSYLEILHIPYLGCPAEASKLAFNKISTKLWLSAVGIPNTPFIFINNQSATSLAKAHEFFAKTQALFVKASSEGSSVGCYKVTKEEDLDKAIADAFTYSHEVLIEECVIPRELEVAAYEYNGELIVTNPGEIITPQNVFYTYDEKYNSASHSTTEVEAKLDPALQQQIKEYAKQAFRLLKLKDLSRIDFFYTDKHGILLNEINTFPGMTPISMFPKMLEHHGETMPKFLESIIDRAVQ